MLKELAHFKRVMTKIHSFNLISQIPTKTTNIPVKSLKVIFRIVDF